MIILGIILLVTLCLCLLVIGICDIVHLISYRMRIIPKSLFEEAIDYILTERSKDRILHVYVGEITSDKFMPNVARTTFTFDAKRRDYGNEGFLSKFSVYGIFPFHMDNIGLVPFYYPGVQRLKKQLKAEKNKSKEDKRKKFFDKIYNK